MSPRPSQSTRNLLPLPIIDYQMPKVPEIESEQPLQDAQHAMPRIIPRSEHPVSRKNIDKEALKVLYRLHDAGYTAYLVGGGVRDLYLGKIPKDFDISTDAKPGQISKLFRNSRLIGRRFRLVQIFFRGGKIIEVSTFRRRSEFEINGENSGGTVEVLAANNTYGTPEDDAFRRDLTINALFYEIDTFSIIDYTGGVEDLDKGMIRLIGDPDRRITRDPVRMMRIIRHAARNNFAIDESTWRAINHHRHELRLCPVSRIRDELLKDLRGGASKPWVQLALDSGLFEVLFPAYQTTLTTSASRADIREQLVAILGVVDRCHNAGPGERKLQIPEHILLTLILIPWAVAEFDIFMRNLKGAEAYRFAREIRARLDEALGHFHIKRAVKEGITSILVNLCHFQRHAGRWPNWLKRKSYFTDCKRLFEIYRESRGGRPIAGGALAELASSSVAEKSRSRRGRGGRRSGRPAFSPGSRGGVFGLKKGPASRK